MAGTTGLEPATSAVTGQHSNQLNYVPTTFATTDRQSNTLRLLFRLIHYFPQNLQNSMLNEPLGIRKTCHPCRHCSESDPEHLSMSRDQIVANPRHLPPSPFPRFSISLFPLGLRRSKPDDGNYLFSRLISNRRGPIMPERSAGWDLAKSKRNGRQNFARPSIARYRFSGWGRITSSSCGWYATKVSVAATRLTGASSSSKSSSPIRAAISAP